MSSRFDSFQAPREAADRRETVVRWRRRAMSEQQLEAYLAARDALRRASRISQLLAYRSRQGQALSQGGAAKAFGAP